jgi:hypothetical protein
MKLPLQRSDYLTAEVDRDSQAQNFETGNQFEISYFHNDVAEDYVL